MLSGSSGRTPRAPSPAVRATGRRTVSVKMLASSSSSDSSRWLITCFDCSRPAKCFRRPHEVQVREPSPDWGRRGRRLGAWRLGRGAPGWQVSTPAGVTYLDAVAFLDERFAVTENKPTSSQLSRITAAFTELGVQADGKIYARPTLEAVNKGFDLATAFDMEKAPAAVGGAVRDFTKAAYQSLPLPLARTA